jgi:succinyl-diaminopimelate desuccinylase
MVDLEDVFEVIDRFDQDRIMDLMKLVIGVDTTAPPGDTYREYVDKISPYFSELGYNLEEVVVPEELVKEIPYPLEGPRINLVATKNFGQDKDISFYGHMDVVPAPNDGEKKWRYPPFEATITKTGKIYGRGTSDMKGVMVCLILALQIIKEMNLTPKYNVTILNCTDEEIGTHPGVAYLAKKGYVKGTIFCMEGTIYPIVLMGTAGGIDIKIESIGKSCHAGQNYMGINALEETIPIMVELMKLKKIVERRESSDIPTIPRGDVEETRNMSPMFNLDVIQSGIKPNIVPNICTLIIDRRMIPDENYEDAKKEIEEAIERGKEKSKLLDVKVSFHPVYPALRIDPNGPGISRMKKVMSKVQNIEEENIQKMGMTGGIDIGMVSQILNTNDIIIHGLVYSGSNPHGVNESIQLRDVKTYIKELITFLCADL